MTAPPAGLKAGGKKLWAAVTETHELDEPQLVHLTEACRAKDRCDQLDRILRGTVDQWARLVPSSQYEDRYILRIDAAFSRATEAATLMKQMIAAMRLPDEVSGKKPQRRGSPKGAEAPTIPGGARQRLRSA